MTYLVGLDVIRAHYLAGLAAYRAGAQDRGTEMFAHGMSEIYVELEPALTKLGVPEFADLMQKTGDLALSKSPVGDVEAAAHAVFSALDGAEAKAPGGRRRDACRRLRRSSRPGGAAVRQALKDRSGDAYLDGYGFFEAAKRARAPNVLAHLTATQSPAAPAARAALDALAAAYPAVTMPERGLPEAGPSLVATSKFRLALSGR